MKRNPGKKPSGKVGLSPASRPRHRPSTTPELAIPAGDRAPRDETVDGWSVLLLVYCACGWSATRTETGIAYCANPRCPRRGTAYVFSVLSREVSYSNRMDCVQ